MTRCALYRHFDATGALLYLGISLSPIERLSQHMSAAPWAEEITTITVQWHPDRKAAEKAEREAILTEKPKNNRTFCHGDTKAIVYELIEALTPEAIMLRLDVSSHSIRAARFKGLIPSSWYDVMRKMCDARGIYCDTRAFAWSGTREAIEAAHVRRFAEWAASRHLPTTEGAST